MSKRRAKNNKFVPCWVEFWSFITNNRRTFYFNKRKREMQQKTSLWYVYLTNRNGPFHFRGVILGQRWHFLQEGVPFDKPLQLPSSPPLSTSYPTPICCPDSLDIDTFFVHSRVLEFPASAELSRRKDRLKLRFSKNIETVRSLHNMHKLRRFRTNNAMPMCYVFGAKAFAIPNGNRFVRTTSSILIYSNERFH